MTDLWVFDYMELWFDVEKRYNAMVASLSSSSIALWFDVEKRYNAIFTILVMALDCRGLM